MGKTRQDALTVAIAAGLVLIVAMLTCGIYSETRNYNARLLQAQGCK